MKKEFVRPLPHGVSVADYLARRGVKAEEGTTSVENERNEV